MSTSEMMDIVMDIVMDIDYIKDSGSLPYYALSSLLLRFHERELRHAFHQSVNHLRHKGDQRSPLVVDAVKMPHLPFTKVVVQAFLEKLVCFMLQRSIPYDSRLVRIPG